MPNATLFLFMWVNAGVTPAKQRSYCVVGSTCLMMLQVGGICLGGKGATSWAPEHRHDHASSCTNNLLEFDGTVDSSTSVTQVGDIV